MTYLNWEQMVELKVQLGHLPFASVQRFSFLPHTLDFGLFTASLAFDYLTMPWS